MAAALAVVSTAGLAWQALGGGADAAPPVRRFIIDADLVTLNNRRPFEISPDGTRLALQSTGGIEVRAFDTIVPQRLLDADSPQDIDIGMSPFWSPDGATIGYALDGGLFKIAATGGSPALVCRLPGEWNAATWTNDDRIVFATTRGPMYSVSARGGDPQVLIPLRDTQELDFHQPSLLPDGRSLLYAVHRTEGVDTIEMWRDGERKVVLRVEPGSENVQENPQIVNGPYFAPSGHILYQRHSGNPGLWAVPFSLPRGETTGEPFLVASGMGFPSVARGGTLVASRLQEAREGQMVIVGRDGRLERALGDPVPGLAMPRYSPDGRRIVYVAAEGQERDLYLWDLEEGHAARLTTTPESEEAPAWIPGTTRIAFTAPAEGCRAAFTMNTDGTGAREPLAAKASEVAFHPSGREIVYTTLCQERRGIDRLVLGQSEPTPLIDAAAGIDSAVLSPDGRTVVYRTWEGGRPQLHASRYPGMDGRWPIAATDSPARWSADGTEFYYISAAPQRMMAVPVRHDPVFAAGSPRVLFDLDAVDVLSSNDFDVAPDGRSFVLVRGREVGADRRSILVVENWFEEFRGR